ncbi:MAG: hypothetical protein ACQR33_04830 [Candidatus Saccharibacteria bacterium]
MQHHGNAPVIVLLIPLIVIAAIVLFFYRAKRRMGVGLGENTIVRCRDGHLFTTIWIPFVSFKAVRFGMMRFQRCPVGNHLTFVVPVDVSTLTPAERDFAYSHHDTNLP